VFIARKPQPRRVPATLCHEQGIEVRTLAVDLTDPADVNGTIEVTAEFTSA
jgi:hypothetical protein